MMKDRASGKNITTLTALNGAVLAEPKSIKKEIVDFYKSLMGTAATSLPAVNIQILITAPQLNHQQAVEIVKDKSKQEVNDCLHTIGNDKAANINGCTIVFFKKHRGLLRRMYMKQYLSSLLLVCCLRPLTVLQLHYCLRSPTLLPSRTTYISPAILYCIRSSPKS